jgi:hypothetical protein
MKTTKWYSGSQQPVREGVYERLYIVGWAEGRNHTFRPFFCYWRTSGWILYAETVMEAHENNRKERFSSSQNLLWRGLTKKPRY